MSQYLIRKSPQRDEEGRHNMGNPGKVRMMLEVIRSLAPVMTDDEISDISKVMLRVTERLEKENNLNLEEEI